MATRACYAAPTPPIRLCCKVGDWLRKRRGKAQIRPRSRTGPRRRWPEPSPDASGTVVSLPRAATECEFDLAPEPGQVMQRARTSDAKHHKSTHAQLEQ